MNLFMLLREYINTLHKFIGSSRPQIVIELFEEAGANHSPIPLETAKSWLKPEGKSHRKCRTQDYFPDGKLNEDRLINYLQSNIDTSWRKLQELFCPINKEGIVNVNTDKAEVFYWSLLNQFKNILKLPLFESDIRNATDGTFSSPEDATCEDTSSNIIDAENITEIVISQEYKMCYYCENWKGNTWDSSKTFNGTYGRCIKYGKDVLSKSQINCNEFLPNYGRIAKSTLTGNSYASVGSIFTKADKGGNKGI